ncbi:MAG TPA: cytochrome C [Phaeodactylibacter sp.]|nr:cytochrome C [Phaeodactylibacter sp.]
MKKINRKTIFLILLGVFILMQFFRIDKTNPPVDAKLDFININQPPENISKMIKSACYDCHSYETKYPWYSNIAPVSWWLKGHIDEARGELNFSEWGSYSAKKASHKMEEAMEEVEEKEMPLTPYVIAHSEAKLSEEQRAALVGFFKKIK